MSEHWYSRDGAPAYEIKAASGAMRPTTLRDARKLGLVPSVTTVLSVIAKPALEAWKVRQGILAALTLPRNQEESDDSYLARVKVDSEAQAKAAAEEGSRIHDAIERHFKGQMVDEFYRPHVRAAVDEIQRLFPGVTDWVAEASFGHTDGFGGKIDLHSPSTGIVVDHKGKDGDFSDGKKLAYDQHWQLGAYQTGRLLRRAPCANIFVSRTHPGKAVGHLWGPDEIEQGWAVFRNALATWKAIRQYDSGYSSLSEAA